MKPPNWYAWAILVVATAASVGLNAVVGIGLAERTIEAEKQARREAAEETRRATCSLINAQASVYRESPPQTSVGRDVARAWEDMRIRFHCQGGS
jgi:hypothetical protein